MIFLLYSFFFNFLPLTKEQNLPNKSKQKDHELTDFVSPNLNTKATKRSSSKPLTKAPKPIYFNKGIISKSKIINYEDDLKFSNDKLLIEESESKKSLSQLTKESYASYQDYSNGIYEGLQESIYINDNNPYTEIINSQFIDFQIPEEQGKYLFIVQKSFVFDNIKFILNKNVITRNGAIKIESNSEVIIQNCEFININWENTIYFAPQKSTLTNENEQILSNLFSIENCSFFECGGETNGQFTILSDGAYDLEIYCCIFDSSKGGIKISETTSSANIESCIFFDCFKTDITDAAVVVISNKKCIFTKNTVNFTSNEDSKSIPGLYILHHGDIVVTHNTFSRIRKISANNYISGSILMKDQVNDISTDDDKCVVFNYNVIEDCGNVKLGSFTIDKRYDFNFDHNIIKNCFINDYSCSINLQNSIKYAHEYQLTNLSLIGCTSCCNTGGGFGLWLTFQSAEYIGVLTRQGKFIMKDCTFENNFIGTVIGGSRIDGGCGGAYHCGNTSTGRTFVSIDGCIFKNNSAEFLGGAVSLLSAPENEIMNSIFINNSAPLGGGAIHLSVANISLGIAITGLMEKCTITNCTFKSNKDKSNHGSAIYFQIDDPTAKTELVIDNCNFIDNGNLDQENENSYSIVANGPGFSFKNSNISFSSSTRSESGIKFEFKTKKVLIESCNFINNSGYAINSSSSYFTFKESNIEFTDEIQSMKTYGGIQINNNGEINIQNSTFTNTQSETGTVYYSPTESSISSSKYIIILGCKFEHCKGGFYINTKIGYNDNINIQETIFQNCYNSNNNKYTAIGTNSDSGDNKITIEKCEFYDCCDPSNQGVSIILIEKSVESNQDQASTVSININYNKIEFSTQDRGCVAIKISRKEIDVIIHNNTFINCSMDKNRDPGAPWANTINTNYIKTLEISESYFYKCGCNSYGDTNGGGNVIGILGLFPTICTIRNCTFDTTSSPVSTYTESTILLRNTFFKCGKNIFRICSSTGSSGFKLIENKFKECTVGCLINCFIEPLKYEPIIERNIFEHIILPETPYPTYDEEHKYAFIFNVQQDIPIVFENNTFREFRTLLGGFGSKFRNDVNTGSEVNLEFNKCFFYDNKQPTHGGSFSCNNIDDYKEGKLYLTFIESYFEGNEANGNGGSLYINTKQDLRIERCTFKSNTANLDSSQTTRDNHGCGGAIYISEVGGLLTINGCTFLNNAANEGQSIYISKSLTQFNLQGTDFIDNVNLDLPEEIIQYMIVLEIGSLDIFSVHFECDENENGEKSYPIFFKSRDAISNINFTNVTSTYSPILYITTPEGQDKIDFNKLTFTDCACNNNYIIEVFDCSNIGFSDTNIIFTELPTEACGGIKIDNCGEINIRSSIFKRTNIITGSIYYKPNQKSTTPTDNVNIEGCTFEGCKGGCCYLNAFSESTETINIIETNFISCTNDNQVDNNEIGFTTLGTSSTCNSINIKVESNKFENCGTTQQNVHVISFISKESPASGANIITFENNTFESDISENCGISLNLDMSERDILIHNCSFIRSTQFGDLNPWSNCIRADSLNKLNISECIFFECGKIGDDDTDHGNVITINKRDHFSSATEGGIDCYVENCIFNHTSTAISSYSERVTFTGNTLYKVGKNSLRISANKYGDYGFVFSDNIVKESRKGIVINSWEHGLRYKPIIQNNTFEHISTTNGGINDGKDPEGDEKTYGFKFTINGDIEILFDNNTFRDITTEILGGFGGKFVQENTSYNDITLTFKDCYFEENKQRSETYGNGGAFGMTNKYISGDIYLTFDTCYFNNNEAAINGGALFLTCNKKVEIKHCKFNSNKAINGDGGAIYIKQIGIDNEGSLTIEDCDFNDNTASKEGQAIYGFQDITRFVLTESNFTNNINLEGNTNLVEPQYMIVLEIGSLEISNVEFTCEANEEKSYPILFKSSEIIENIVFNKVSSEYSALLYIASANQNDQIKFNDLTFIDCICQEYIIDSFVHTVSLENCHIQFSTDSEDACGGIRINNYGSIEIIQSFFNNTKSSTGSIYYNNDQPSTNQNSLNIQYCQFNGCIGKTINIEAPTNSLESIEINYNTFDNCYNNIDEYKGTAINIGDNTASISLTIQGNTFEKCNNDNTKSILISLVVNSEPINEAEKNIEIRNNSINYDIYKKDKCKLAIQLLQNGREVTIHNCTFNNCYKMEGGAWANAIFADKLSTLTVSECNFYQCGYNQLTTIEGGNVIGILGNSDTAVIVKNCTFDTSSASVSSYVENTEILGNTFIKCGRNTIRITSKRTGSERFKLIENKFLNSTTGCVLLVWKEFLESDSIKNPPIIRGNLFQNNRIDEFGFSESKFLFIFDLNEMSTILFENNTFCNIKTYLGGFAANIKSNLEVNLTFSNCLFENNTQSTNGGAFCSNDENNGGDISLTFNECFFTNNNVDGDGGALYIDTNKNVHILGCQFTSNTATNGGAIYISQPDIESYNCIIVECIFDQNCAYLFGNSIFINDKNQNHIYVIENNKFTNNYCDKENFGYVIASKKLSIDIDSNTFYNNDETVYINPIVYLDENDNIILINLVFKDMQNALVIKEDTACKLIKNCTFINCCTNEHYVVILHKIITFENNTISFDSFSCNSTAGLLVSISSPCEETELNIIDSTFIGCSSTTLNSATGIYIEDNNDLFLIIVSSCRFYDCHSPRCNVINVECKSSTITDSIFSFSSNNYQRSCSAIHVNNEYITISYNKFINCSSYCIRNRQSSEAANIEESIFNLNYNVFTSCIPYNYNGVSNIFRMWEFEFSSSPSIAHNIVEDVVYENYYLFISCNRNDLLLENNTFRNLHLGASFGGGLSHWFVSRNREYFKLTFKDCKFINNEALPHYRNEMAFNNIQGGAIQHGWTPSISDTFLTFDGCEFTSNKAPDEGGAIAIETTKEVNIQNCIFKNNAGSRGGAIYIFPDYVNPIRQHEIQDKINIRSCQFLSNVATNGNAIYIDKGNSTTVEISNCSFSDDDINEVNSLGFCIVSGCKSTIISNSSIKIKNADKFDGALYINGKSSVNINKFMIYSDLNQAIKLDNSLKFSDTWMINVTDSQFLEMNGYDDSCEICTILLSDSTVDSISKFILLNNQFSDKLLKLEISETNPINIDNIRISECNSESGIILNLPIINSNIITFSNLIIENCSARSLFSITPLNIKFDKCNFTSNQFDSSGLISIRSNQIVNFSNCLFISNKDHNIGGIIYIESSQMDEDFTELRIEKCKFIDNDGSSIYSDNKFAHVVIHDNTTFSSSSLNSISYMIVLYNCNLEMSNTEFDCNLPLLFANTVENIEFRNVISKKSSFLIISENHPYSLRNMKFYNCKSNEYVIESNNIEFSIFNSSIEFTDSISSQSSGGININGIGNHKIISTNFTNTVQRALNYVFRANEFRNEIATVTDCIFDGCSGKTTDRIFVFTVSHDVVFQNNTIKNTHAAVYGGVFQFENFDEFTLDSCIFMNNSMTGDDYSGGSGLWINRIEKLDQIRKFLRINFINCQWIRNYVDKPSGGGGIQIGRESISNIELIFSKCMFIENKAKKGGALTIQTVQPLTITDCFFFNNEAYSNEGCGGALFIEPNFENRKNDLKMESCEIINCTFEGNFASSKNGHAICMEGGVDTLLCIYYNNTFKDNNNENGGGSAILYRGQNIYLEFPHFSDQKKSRFIEFGKNSEVDLNNVHFKDCYEKDGGGNAIKISEEATSVSLTSCTFKNCGSSGFAINDLGAKITFTSCLFSFDDKSKACCSLDISSSMNCKVINCSFINNFNNNQNNPESAPLFYHPTDQQDSVIIQNCLFDSCDGLRKNLKTFSIQTKLDLTFMFNAIQNVGSRENPAGYVGQIIALEIMFEIDHCNFTNIVSSSQFGGGCGFLISTTKVVFNECKFINNEAIQMTNSEVEQRPQPDGIQGVYYNGDGGAIQFGYLSSTSNTDLEFTKCVFKDNKASRHGGAVAIQTLKTVNIIDCIFESNIADTRQTSSSSSELLSYENHFDKKNEGRGGGIYINPTFSYHNNEGEIYPSNNEHMKLINIDNCTFISNLAFDGFAIYIEGDEPENEFEISILNNEFLNNKQNNGENDINQSFRAIIASEVNLPCNEIESKNQFDPENTQKIALVDHYGNLIVNLPIPPGGDISSNEQIEPSGVIDASSSESASSNQSEEVIESSSESSELTEESSSISFEEPETSSYNETETNETMSTDSNEESETSSYNETETNETTSIESNEESETSSYNETETNETMSTDSNEESETSSYNETETNETMSTDSNEESETSSYNETETNETTSIESNEESETSSIETMESTLIEPNDSNETSSLSFDESQEIGQSTLNSDEYEEIKTSSTESVYESSQHEVVSQTVFSQDFSSSFQNNGSFIGSNDKKKGLSTGAIIGIVCGIVIFVAALISVLVFVFIWKKRSVPMNSFHPDDFSNKNYSKTDEKAIDRDEEDIDLDFWL